MLIRLALLKVSCRRVFCYTVAALSKLVNTLHLNLKGKLNAKIFSLICSVSTSSAADKKYGSTLPTN